MTDTNHKSLFNEAGVPGLILGAISILYFAVNELLSSAVANGSGIIAFNILSFVLWGAKLFACIYVMYLILKKFATANGGNKSLTMKFGMLTALCSSLLYSAACLAFVLFISPESISTALESTAQMYAGLFTSDQIDSIMDMQSSIPALMFFVNLVYCWLWGLVLSAIFSSKLCKKENPFID